MKFTAQTVTGECKCGGYLMDTRTSSYQITSDTTSVVCDLCAKVSHMQAAPKTARLFV